MACRRFGRSRRGSTARCWPTRIRHSTNSTLTGSSLREGPAVPLQILGLVSAEPRLSDVADDLRAAGARVAQVRVEVVDEHPGLVRATICAVAVREQHQRAVADPEFDPGM